MVHSIQHVSDEELSLRFEQGDADVIPEILRRYSSYIRSSIEQISVLRRADVDDILARSFAELWEKRRQYSSAKAKLKTWWRLLARNVAINFLRRPAIKFREVPLELFDSLATNQNQRERPTQYAKAVDCLKEIMEGLSDTDRRILYAQSRDLGDEHVPWASNLSKEIGITASTIRSRRIRLHKMLKKKLINAGINLGAENAKQ